MYIIGERARKSRECAAEEQFLGNLILNNPHIMNHTNKSDTKWSKRTKAHLCTCISKNTFFSSDLWFIYYLHPKQKRVICPKRGLPGRGQAFEAQLRREGADGPTHRHQEDRARGQDLETLCFPSAPWVWKTCRAEWVKGSKKAELIWWF